MAKFTFTYLIFISNVGFWPKHFYEKNLFVKILTFLGNFSFLFNVLQKRFWKKVSFEILPDYIPFFFLRFFFFSILN